MTSTQTMPIETQYAPVRKTITVNASADHAFKVFTHEIDAWWPRTHHIGSVPMKKCIIEERLGGRCYSEQGDGTECEWGRILVWEPPQRFVMAWKINTAWKYEAELSKSSEVEVRFTPEPGGGTRVDLEHRHFERCGEGADVMRQAVDSPGGWFGLLELFRAESERTS